MSSFKDVVGHKNIIKYIESAVQADAVSHAYILNGERGSGKKLLANLFAMSLQCQDRDENGEACGKCQSCKQALHGNQPDIIRVSHEKPTTISVDDIRQQVNNDIVIKPYSSKYKVYIVDEAEKMKDKIDVLILCGGSATDLPVQTPKYAQWFKFNLNLLCIFFVFHGTI